MPGLESKGFGGITNIKCGEIEAVGLPEGESFQSITGVGFKPKVVFFFSFGVGGTYQMASHGFDAGGEAGVSCVVFRGNKVDIMGAPADSIYIQQDSGIFISGHISSMDDDGFTIRWYVSGVINGTIYYIAMK